MFLLNLIYKQYFQFAPFKIFMCFCRDIKFIERGNIGKYFYWKIEVPKRQLCYCEILIKSCLGNVFRFTTKKWVKK